MNYGAQTAGAAYAGNVLGGTGGTAVDRDTIQSAQNRQDAANAELHNVLSMLEEKLAVLLEPAPPNVNDKRESAPTPIVTNLVHRGHNAVTVTEHAICRINALIHRLQL